MKNKTLLVVSLCTGLASESASATDWVAYSLYGSPDTVGFIFDQYYDFFPVLSGASLYKTTNNFAQQEEHIINAHLGFGMYTFNMTFGVGYSNSNNWSGLISNASVSGGFALDKEKHFAISPYATKWSSKEETRSEIGIKLTYSPSGLRNTKNR
jgi:hypothetical protein